MSTPNQLNRTLRSWLEMLSELRSERRKAPSEHYTHRRIFFATYDECDAGGVPVVEYTVEPEEIDDIVELLAGKL